MRGLYAIVDVDALAARGLDPLRATAALLAAVPAALQLRAKGLGARAHLELLRAVADRCARAGVLCFANDRPDLALLAGCSGVHLGQTDLPPYLARQLAEQLGRPLRIGMSVHHAAQLEAALAERCDYLAFGPVFTTASKAAADPVLGAEGLAALAARAREVFTGPLVAIGGITLARARRIAEHCDAGAVIAGLLAAPGGSQPTRNCYDDMTVRGRRLHAALSGVPEVQP